MMLGIHWVSASWPEYCDECVWLSGKELLLGFARNSAESVFKGPSDSDRV